MTPTLTKKTRPFSDDTIFMLELFQAKPVRTTKELTLIYGDQDKVYKCIQSLRRNGFKFIKQGLGIWELEGDV